ncbi:hypothetical protein ASE85_03370 [Sphingobium sp. Leaf26]|nr:hypothetical protein ASE85_03370 [Sphingobium sp. Leaf26]
MDDMRRAAEDVLIEAGALTKCDVHGDVYDCDSDRLASAYPIANSKISSGQIVLPSGWTRKDFTDVVKSVYEDNSNIDYCPSCDKNDRS